MLNKSKGNMYGFVTDTWNPIRGICPFGCDYCYMKKYWHKMKKPRLVTECFNDDLGNNNFIFIGSSIDMFASQIPSDWIKKVLEYCNKFPTNTYLFQTKNPIRFKEFYAQFNFEKNILGTTIETNKNIAMITSAPSPLERATAFQQIYWKRKMISIEPIMDFDLEELVVWIKNLKPEFVSIGADSQRNNLPEPSKEKIERLIEELKKFTEIKLKSNLKRLMK